jgi:hypothetical protein
MLSEQSIVNLRKVEQFILKEPRRFNMMAGVNKSIKVESQLEQPPCGTACCIAGAAFLIDAGIKMSGRKRGLEIDLNKVLDFGARFLDLNYEQKEMLFYPWRWPEPYQALYNNAETAHERAAVGALMIEHFIATNGQL